jgi:hypothetical protein
MLLYADEDFELPVVQVLRRLGHDVVTAHEDGRQSSDDFTILTTAHSKGRAVLTNNRRHFERLHQQGHPHSGIISCRRDQDFLAVASRINAAIIQLVPGRWCLRINRPR